MAAAQEPVRLTLPLPPNANHYRGINYEQRRVFVREEGEAYHRTVAGLALAAGLRTPLAGPVHITKLHVYRARRAGDLDGFEKVLFDALQGSVYANDKQIVAKDGIRLLDDKANPRVELEVRSVVA